MKPPASALVACPVCRAPKGAPCTRPDGSTRPSHSERRADAALENLADCDRQRSTIPEFDFVCPFCNGIVRTVEDGLLHAMPPCDMFLRVEPDYFVARVNEIHAAGLMQKVRVELCKPCARMLKQVEIAASAVGEDLRSAFRRAIPRTCAACRAQLPAELRARLDDERKQEN